LQGEGVPTLASWRQDHDAGLGGVRNRNHAERGVLTRGRALAAPAVFAGCGVRGVGVFAVPAVFAVFAA
jgi:hypothetical protein